MRLQLLGQLDGTPQRLREILQPVYSLHAPSAVVFLEELPYWQAEAKVSEAGLPAYFKERSRFFNQPFDANAIATAFNWCRRWPATVKSATFKAFQTGGAVNAIPANATAFVHRNSHWLSSIDTVWSEDTTESALQKSLEWQTGCAIGKRHTTARTSRVWRRSKNASIPTMCLRSPKQFHKLRARVRCNRNVDR